MFTIYHSLTLLLLLMVSLKELVLSATPFLFVLLLGAPISYPNQVLLTPSQFYQPLLYATLITRLIN